jgi:hypothetical protein
MFSGFGGRAVHPGRQKMPVLRTAMINAGSAGASGACGAAVVV